MVFSIGSAPVYGTRPCVGLCPTVPQKELGMRIEPAWSPPSAMSTSPAATSAALPLEEPPVDFDRSQGLRTGPVCEGWLPPAKQSASQAALPAIVAPAASSRATTVASRRGTKPSMVAEPFIIGTPATAMLSLTAMRRPARGPSSAPLMSVVTYQAPSSLAASVGRCHFRTGGSGERARLAWYSCSTTSYEVSAPAISSRNFSTSSGPSPSPYRSAIAAISSFDGGVTGTVISPTTSGPWLSDTP